MKTWDFCRNAFCIFKTSKLTLLALVCTTFACMNFWTLKSFAYHFVLKFDTYSWSNNLNYERSIQQQHLHDIGKTKLLWCVSASVCECLYVCAWSCNFRNQTFCIINFFRFSSASSIYISLCERGGIINPSAINFMKYWFLLFSLFICDFIESAEDRFKIKKLAEKFNEFSSLFFLFIFSFSFTRALGWNVAMCASKEVTVGSNAWWLTKVRKNFLSLFKTQLKQAYILYFLLCRYIWEKNAWTRERKSVSWYANGVESKRSNHDECTLQSFFIKLSKVQCIYLILCFFLSKGFFFILFTF